MRYRVSHRTEYLYGELVPLCHNVVRLRPRETARQRCLRNRLTVEPITAEQRAWVDFFGNHVTWISVQEPHRALKVAMESEVEVQPLTLAPDFKGPAWDDSVERIRTARDGTLLAAREYTFESLYITHEKELSDYARKSFEPGKPLLAAVMDLTLRINHEFTFDTNATTVGTPSLEVLHHRRGVCQDFAHLQIGCLRSMGLAARYVSGYVLTRPPSGRPRLVGADASHAWVSVFIPDCGWIDFDPTNGHMPTDEHITIGWGRDYDDISPVKGVITSGLGQTLRYAVDVEPIVPLTPVTEGNGTPVPPPATPPETAPIASV